MCLQTQRELVASTQDFLVLSTLVPAMARSEIELYSLFLCLDTELIPLSLVQTELCIAPGPGKDMFESTKIIATKQYGMGKVTTKKKKKKKPAKT